ncbi:hypothetical protein M2156_004531 [Streptomyces sp. SAI-149]|nr:hypothetical protein [Streptomyces sp. SAI-119]MDH6498312.1 hypothetical protein [Streptomyces sp. SAI-149]
MTEQTEEKPTRPVAPAADRDKSELPDPGVETARAEAAVPVHEAGQVGTPDQTGATDRADGVQDADQPDRSDPQARVQPPRPAEPPATTTTSRPEPARTPESAAAPAPVAEPAPAPVSGLVAEPTRVPESAAAPEGVAEPVPAPVSGLVAEPTREVAAQLAAVPEPGSAPVPASGSAPMSEPGSVSASDSGPAPAADPALAPDPAPKNRRVLRATLRWTAAVLAFAAFGAGTAYGIAGMERTDVPGLGTVSDGRWVYPTLTKAPLPSGSPGPLDAENKAGSHYADLRALVLPAPQGATVDKALSGTDGWLATKDLLSEYAEKEDREELGKQLSESGLRHIAARGWSTPDGTHTRIYLLQFDTAAVADDLFGRVLAPYGSPHHALRDAPDSVSDEHFPDAARIQDITASVYVESKPYGGEQTRHAYISAGDVLALVVQSRKGAANPVPFQQTVTLQSQLLG